MATAYSEVGTAQRRDDLPITHQADEIRRGDQAIASDVTDANGRTASQKSESVEGLSLRFKDANA